jgi:hypothetical protein
MSFTYFLTLSELVLGHELKVSFFKFGSSNSEMSFLHNDSISSNIRFERYGSWSNREYGLSPFILTIDKDCSWENLSATEWFSKKYLTCPGVCSSSESFNECHRLVFCYWKMMSKFFLLIDEKLNVRQNSTSKLWKQQFRFENSMAASEEVM